MSRSVCIAIHDVAPATWPQCETLLDLVERLGAPPATLLVVPDYHRRGRVDRDPAFLRAIDRRIARGDEIALHGYLHLDDGPSPHSPFEWLKRRVLTAGEGEFAALTEHESATRLGEGLRVFERLGWDVAGFVAPAWLLGDGARAALAKTPLRYTSTHAHLERLADGRRIAAPAISASTRSAWRRWTSRRWLRLARAVLRNEPIVRVALHPADAGDARILEAWHALLAALAADRVALTKSAAIETARASSASVAWARA